MDKRTTDIVAYLSWPGLLIAFLLGDRQGSRFHINQSLVIWVGMTLIGVFKKIVGFFGDIPILGWTIGLAGGTVSVLGVLFCALCLFIGIINAIQGVEKEVPLLGQIHLL